MHNKIMHCQTLHACHLLNMSSMAKVRFISFWQQCCYCARPRVFLFFLLQVTFNTRVHAGNKHTALKRNRRASMPYSVKANFGLIYVLNRWFKCALLYFRRPITYAVFTPPRPTSPAHDGLHVAGSEETRRHELLESGRICLFGDRHGTRVAHV